MADNPYEAPSSDLSGNDTFSAQAGGVTHGVVEQLRRTKGWTRFISVLCFIFGVLLLILAIFGGSAFSTLDRSVRIRGVSGVLGLIFLIYGIMGVLQMVIGAKLGGFSSAVQRLMYSAEGRDLEDALDRQRGFWVFIGVTMMVVLIIGFIAVFRSLGTF